jgi:hypothetical protein
MKTISKESEVRILDAIQDVCSHVNDGSNPTDAVIKVAEDCDLNKHFIRLVCTGYNTGATTYQREKGAGVLDKLADFPIANTEKAIDALYPSKILSPSVKKASTAVSDEYSKAPTAIKAAEFAVREKIASVALDYGIEKVSREIPREEQLQHAMNQRGDIKREVQNHKTKYANSQDILLSSLGQLGDYFKQAYVDWSFEEVDSAMSHRFGKSGSIVMDFVFDRNGSKEKRAQAKIYKAVDWDAVPFKLATDCIKQAQAVNSLRTKYDSFSKEAAEKIAELYAPFYPAPTENKVATTSVLGKSGMAKRSGIFSSVVGSSMASKLKGTAPTEQVSDMAMDLNDPEHTEEMRAVKARTMIQDFMLNDEVISGYDPDEVISAYNEISELSPRSSVQPAIIRPLLRKHLTQGAIEPFEAAEMADIETKLMKNQSGVQQGNVYQDSE